MPAEDAMRVNLLGIIRLYYGYLSVAVRAALLLLDVIREVKTLGLRAS